MEWTTLKNKTLRKESVNELCKQLTRNRTKFSSSFWYDGMLVGTSQIVKKRIAAVRQK